MSIASEITRISNAKTAIGTAIAAKGVTVPSGTKLDGFAQLIAAISGGISIDGMTEMAGGSFTKTNSSTTTITHGMSAAPTGVIIFSPTFDSSTKMIVWPGTGGGNINTNTLWLLTSSGWNDIRNSFDVDSDKIVYRYVTYLNANHLYCWLAWR